MLRHFVEYWAILRLGQLHSRRCSRHLLLRLFNAGSAGNRYNLTERTLYLDRYRSSLILQTISYALTIFATTYCLPLIIIILCYFFIVKSIFTRETDLHEQTMKMNVTSMRSSDNNTKSNEIRVAKCAMFNISFWIGMWTPYAAVVLLGALGDQSQVTPLITILSSTVAKCASIGNPIIFAMYHPKYRLVR